MLMSLVLDAIYLLAAAVLSPWLVYALAFKRNYRQGLLARFGLRALPELKQSIWLHGASAGEVLLMRPLLKRLETTLPKATFVISTVTSTGKLAAEKAYPRHQVIYFPLDLSPVVRIFFRRLKPKIIIVFESEFWPNFLLCARRANIPVVLLNGKLSPRSYLAYKRTLLIPWLLKQLSLLAVQNEEYAERFHRLGVAQEKIAVTGNMKYDLPHDTGGKLARGALRKEFGYPPDRTILIGGSTHSGEHEALIYAFSRLRKAGYRLQLILVPRYPAEATAIERKVEQSALSVVRRTSLHQTGHLSSLDNCDSVLIVDTMGELTRFYAMADIAYVGGSLFFRKSNKGGHNLMEPAMLGLAVLFGPYNFSFRDTVATLMSEAAAIMVRDQEDLYQQLADLLTHPQRVAELGQKARTVMLKQRGATARTMELLSALTAQPARALC
jgi:3-deoxy-D-manno-octulosonic-acid transferase